MTFRRTRGGWNSLNSLKYLESLHAHMPFVHNLKQFTCLRKLKLETFSYSRRGLAELDQLESLELIPNISKNNFEILVTNCQQLERLAFGVKLLDSTVPYELVCQLPKLQHLQVWHGGSLRESFIEGLINRQGSPLESLILKGHGLKEAQVQHLCNISTLKKLDIFCDTLPFVDLLKLKNLVYFHISSPMTEDQLLHLLDALPRLKVLNLLFCPELYVPFFD
ncbi:GL23661 [Drosophila persimilis]|uniref:GL23661 n=1 Tax=Drosophila persimilis TaxID=7234 RepID=B4G6F8_DROPE|nr:GL23661 [Drosophila persimilis]